MNCKKYRICLVIFIVVVIGVSLLCYVWKTRPTETPVDGMLVENCVEKEENGSNEELS